jgi:hypothetical protein
MGAGRPPGRTALATQGPPIYFEGPGRTDDWRPESCDSCKVPAKSAKLLTFRLWSLEHRKWAGAWTLCMPCWDWRNSRPDPDPRHVEEDAA